MIIRPQRPKLLQSAVELTSAWVTDVDVNAGRLGNPLLVGRLAFGNLIVVIL